MAGKAKQLVPAVTVRFAGDSGDGMQLTGDQFTDTTAVMGNDFSTFPDFPAEIRAPAGTLPGVSSFQIQFSETPAFTPGDVADVLIAMNPAALKVNLRHVKKGGLMILNENAFDEDGLEKAAFPTNPLTDGTLRDWQVVRLPLSDLTVNALKDHPLRASEKERCKNFFALGLMFWLYDRNLDHTIEWISAKFAKKPEFVAANIAALKAGYNHADITELMPTRFEVRKSKLEPGTYRKVTGNEAAALGFIAAAELAGKTLFLGSYPITPASSILQDLSYRKDFGVRTFQAEDEIAAIGSAIGASFGGELGITTTSGPGLCLKSEALNLAVIAELPLVVIDVQRTGPSTGMPTKTEQTDLLQAMFGRNGESPVAVVAPQSPAHCFETAIEAVRLALTHMTPVIYLSDGYLANSAEPWKLPALESLPKITVQHPTRGKGPFQPYARDPQTLARPWAKPGTPGLEHRIGGLEKADITGTVSYDPDNHEKMVKLRAEKVARIADDIPELTVRGPQSGPLLVLGWGSTHGAIHAAVDEVNAAGKGPVAQAHLTHLNPFPKNLGAVLSRYKTVLVPELNSGQLLMLLRHQFHTLGQKDGTRLTGYNRIRGVPFFVSEVRQAIEELL
ncbi:MAG: 2-oxoacid:acceptor oxidoreductase subunit alpha [Elusimicrobia bacterium]|jgi:2-oxoglutarate ferredoxin oxidoreductase subunit alpha|nr:2-oxoacid:acceptor oxidoreductase subunit alpha [Elusimicrobiota bacterium]MBK7545692.1 2-oxoacid:acceptor oxidoreductase subunit alpha [Elusimicrobiota bacterium]MBK7574955.1 2-oxoacid:acceptor oxidoreductase subunit alpha [Elusimicrobiota bacterium]MBK8125301.1 2-oxoacid:acceptor oxidoreductase subunit alpha [Elusimicrobiota bacterium]MBK8424013.1 2-oxoacid:acceptor oxidoreductase subunit alpha [Elusimicrobiota bacterium]